MIILTASFLFWLDGRYESKTYHSREICELRNELLVLSNGLAKVVLKDQSEEAYAQIKEYGDIGNLNSAQAIRKLTLEGDLERYQKLLVHIESANLEDLKNVCS